MRFRSGFVGLCICYDYGDLPGEDQTCVEDIHRQAIGHTLSNESEGLAEVRHSFLCLLNHHREASRSELWQSGGIALISALVLVPYLGFAPPTPIQHSSDCGEDWVTAQIIGMGYIALLSLMATWAAMKVALPSF